MADKKIRISTKDQLDRLATSLCEQLRYLSLQISIANQRLEAIETRVFNLQEDMATTMTTEWLIDKSAKMKQMEYENLKKKIIKEAKNELRKPTA